MNKIVITKWKSSLLISEALLVEFPYFCEEKEEHDDVTMKRCSLKIRQSMNCQIIAEIRLWKTHTKMWTKAESEIDH